MSNPDQTKAIDAEDMAWLAEVASTGKVLPEVRPDDPAEQTRLFLRTLDRIADLFCDDTDILS